MSNSVYGKDSTINGNINISGNLQNKNKVFNTDSFPSLGNGARNLTTDIIDYSVTLSNPLAETIVLDTATIKQATLTEFPNYPWVIANTVNYQNSMPPSSPYPEYSDYPVKLLVTLPAITTGITVNFIKNNVLSVVTFETSNSDRIIRYGTEYQAIKLLSFYNTSIQLIGLSNNKWVVNDLSLPPQISNPAGSIITMSVSNLPKGYLACDGLKYPLVNYPDLYDVIGFTYGRLNNYFYVPNFNNGSFLRGIGDKSLSIGSQQSDNIKTHTHSTTYYYRSLGGSTSEGLSNEPATNNPTTTTMVSQTNTAGSPDETRPMNYAVYYCIKY